MMAYTGDSFCGSAKDAAILVYENFDLFAVVNSAITAYSILGSFFIVGLSMLIGALYAYGYKKDEWIVFIIVLSMFISALVATLFLSTISIVIQSMYLYFCLDEKLQAYGIRELRPMQGVSHGQEYYEGDQFMNDHPFEILSGARPILVVNGAQRNTVISKNSVGSVISPSTIPANKPLYQKWDSTIKPDFASRDYNQPGYVHEPNIDYGDRDYNRK